MILWEGRMREERDKFPPVCRTQLLFCYMRPQEQGKTMPTLPAWSRGSTVVTILAMWSCGSEKSMISLIFTVCRVSVYGSSQPWRTPILCVYLAVAWLLPCDQLLFDLSTQMAHGQIKSRLCPNLTSQCLFPKYCYPDLSLLSQQKHTPPKAAQHQVFLFLSHKLVMRPNSKPTKILPSDELTPSFWWACNHSLRPAPSLLSCMRIVVFYSVYSVIHSGRGTVSPRSCHSWYFICSFSCRPLRWMTRSSPFFSCHHMLLLRSTFFLITIKNFTPSVSDLEICCFL